MRYILFVAFLFFCYPTYAQEEIGPRLNLPVVSTVTFKDGVPDQPIPDGQYKVLGVNHWQTVLNVAIAYQGLYNWRLEIQGTLNAYSETINNYELALKNLNAQLKLEKGNTDYYKLRLGQVEKAQSQDAFRNKFERFALYSVIAVQMVIIGVVGVKGAAN